MSHNNCHPNCIQEILQKNNDCNPCDNFLSSCRDPKPRACYDTTPKCENWIGMPGCRRCRFLHCKCGLCRHCRIYEYICSISVPAVPPPNNNPPYPCQFECPQQNQRVKVSKCKEKTDLPTGGPLVTEYRVAYQGNGRPRHCVYRKRPPEVGGGVDYVNVPSTEHCHPCKPPWRSTMQVEPQLYKASLGAVESKLRALDRLLRQESVAGEGEEDITSTAKQTDHDNLMGATSAWNTISQMETNLPNAKDKTGDKTKTKLFQSSLKNADYVIKW